MNHLNEVYFIKLYLTGWQWLMLIIIYLFHYKIVNMFSPEIKKWIKDKIIKSKSDNIGFK